MIDYARRCCLAMFAFVCCTSTGFADDLTSGREEQIREHLQLLANYYAGEPVNADGVGLKPPTVDLSEFRNSLEQLPDGHPLRLKAIVLARKYAKPSELVKQPEPGSGYHHHAHRKLRFAWGVLITTECLRSGMRLEEFVAIIGDRPQLTTQRGVDHAAWYYPSMMHVNPGLRIMLESGQVKSIEISHW